MLFLNMLILLLTNLLICYSPEELRVRNMKSFGSFTTKDTKKNIIISCTLCKFFVYFVVEKTEKRI